MIAEALDTLITLGWAFLAWLTIVAAVATLALWTLTLAVCLTARAAWRLLHPYRSLARRTHQKKPSDQTTAHTAAAITAPSHDSPDTKRQNSSITTNPATSPAPFRTQLMTTNYPGTEAR
ncbi:hypothetical protein [Streptomyces sp. NPDC048188]|uniref:hypothetical protein n=1 Tax=Streptomyces sp. NPDC048188 TaxID=3155749 RepID=UPI00343DA4F4